MYRLGFPVTKHPPSTATKRLDEVRFHQKAPKRTFLTRREADVLLGAMERLASDAEEDVTENATGDAWAAHAGQTVRLAA